MGLQIVWHKKFVNRKTRDSLNCRRSKYSNMTIRNMEYGHSFFSFCFFNNSSFTYINRSINFVTRTYFITYSNCWTFECSPILVTIFYFWFILFVFIRIWLLNKREKKIKPDDQVIHLKFCILIFKSHHEDHS